MARGDNSKGWPVKKPAKGAGIGGPKRGAGRGGPASGGKRVKFTAEMQPSPEAKSAGHEAAQTAREEAKRYAVEMLQLIRDIARDPTAPHHARSDAAEKVIARAEGRAAIAIGGDPNGVPVKTVVQWDDGED